MDVQRNNTRERVFSILNDNDCKSFVHRTKQSSPSSPPVRLPSISSLTSQLKLERPSLARLPQFGRNSSISSVGSPPLLRYDSSSSTNSNSSMEGSPSPSTPSIAYNYNDAALMPYDALLRQDSMNYLPSPTGITPFVEQSLMMGPIPGQEIMHAKPPPQLMPAGYPSMPMATSMPEIPTPALSADQSVSSTTSQPAPGPATANGTTAKKNKYPCPYAQSHNCSATFTTSGHAARHGKKHTGEKGVHCPVCDKAFTRKDNMKQHERTHKNRGSNGTEKKSKAQTTREADQAKEAALLEQPEMMQPQVLPTPAQFRKQSSGLSDPSDGTLAVNPVVTPVDISPAFFADPNPQIVLPGDASLLDPTVASMYPPLVDEALLMSGGIPNNEKLEVHQIQPPTLVRGFSDLDTLAQAASESQFDPYFNQPQF